MRTKREVISEIIYQCEQAFDVDGAKVWVQVLEEILENGSQNDPSFFDVTDDGCIFLVDHGLFSPVQPLIGEA